MWRNVVWWVGKNFPEENLPPFSVNSPEFRYPLKLEEKGFSEIFVSNYQNSQFLAQKTAFFYVHGSVHRESMLIIVQQDATTYSLLYFCNLLYMFRVVIPPIIRSKYNCNYSIWHWSNRLCYLPLWWSWNCAPDDGWSYHPKHVQQFLYIYMCVCVYIYIYRAYIYIYRFQNVFLRCPTPRLHCFLSSHWPSFRFL